MIRITTTLISLNGSIRIDNFIELLFVILSKELYAVVSIHKKDIKSQTNLHIRQWDMNPSPSSRSGAHPHCAWIFITYSSFLYPFKIQTYGHNADLRISEMKRRNTFVSVQAANLQSTKDAISMHENLTSKPKSGSLLFHEHLLILHLFVGQQ